jgi:hypothetical protein
MKNQNVVFRVFPGVDNEVIALFCDTEKDCNPGNVMSYMHIGQHSEASKKLGQNLRLAKPEEYKKLHSELSAIYAPEFHILPVSRLKA